MLKLPITVKYIKQNYLAFTCSEKCYCKRLTWCYRLSVLSGLLQKRKNNWTLWWTRMRPERKQKAEDGELERPSNHMALGLVPCFSATVTPPSTHLFCPCLAAIWNNLTLLLYPDNNLCSIEWGRCTSLAQDFRVMSCLERKKPWPPWHISVCSLLYFARVYK